MKFIKTFILNGLILTLTSLILRCIGMFFNSYISQKIGAEAIGLYGLIMSVYNFGITIALSRHKPCNNKNCCRRNSHWKYWQHKKNNTKMFNFQSTF